MLAKTFYKLFKAMFSIKIHIGYVNIMIFSGNLFQFLWEFLSKPCTNFVNKINFHIPHISYTEHISVAAEVICLSVASFTVGVKR